MPLSSGPNFKIPKVIEDFDIDFNVMRYIAEERWIRYNQDIWNTILWGPRWHEMDDGDTIIRGEN